MRDLGTPSDLRGKEPDRCEGGVESSVPCELVVRLDVRFVRELRPLPTFPGNVVCEVLLLTIPRDDQLLSKRMFPSNNDREFWSNCHLPAMIFPRRRKVPPAFHVRPLPVGVARQIVFCGSSCTQVTKLSRHARYSRDRCWIRSRCTSRRSKAVAQCGWTIGGNGLRTER